MAAGASSSRKRRGPVGPAPPPTTRRWLPGGNSSNKPVPTGQDSAAKPIRSQRQLIYRWTEQLFGLRGVLELASAEVDLLTYTYADASLDSELSLLWWDRDLYPVAWRWGNPLYLDSAPTTDDLPILMVSRLDAPTADLAKGLVDQAMQAERSGLQGTVYFDARGLIAKDATDTYGVYDQSLRDAAEVVDAAVFVPSRAG